MTVRLPLLETTTLAEAERPGSGPGRLETDQGQLPLVSLTVAAEITALTVGTRLTQEFRNSVGVPLEATYVFPLPERAAVTSFTARIGERQVDGVLKERGQARQEYDEALAAGYRAAIAEQERSDVFTVRVGNIAPGETARIELTLAGPVAVDGNEATFRFPLVVAPRYVPGQVLDDDFVGDGVVPDTDLVPDASRISPPVLLPGQASPVSLTVTCSIDPAGLGLSDLRSSLHTVVTDTGSDEQTGPLTVRLQPGERLDRDFVLRWRFGSRELRASATITPDDTRQATDTGGDGSAATLTVTVVPPAPDPAAPARPRDVVILLDRSGSMGGWKIVAARRAAARIVDSLMSADRFAVLAFDHQVEHPPESTIGLRPGTDRDRFAAVEFLSALQARGGTEMAEALNVAARLLGRRPTAEETAADRSTVVEKRQPILVLVTDGQVGNEDHLLASLAPRLTGVDVHVIGIDRAVGAGLLGRLSKLGTGSGHAELVESEDRLDVALSRVSQRIVTPVLTDVRLSVHGATLAADTVVPAGSTACPAGVPLVLRARLRDLGPGPVRVIVTARTPDGQPWSTTLDAIPAPGGAPTAVWAREHLQHLEDRWQAGGSQDRNGVAGMVLVSLGYRVLCRFTAFVAVDRTSTVGDGTPLSVVQPVEAPSGWDLGTGSPAFLRTTSRLSGLDGLSAAIAGAPPGSRRRLGRDPTSELAYDAFDPSWEASAAPPPPPSARPASRQGKNLFDRIRQELDDIESAVTRRRAKALRAHVEALAQLAEEADRDLPPSEAVEELVHTLRGLAEALVDLASGHPDAADHPNWREGLLLLIHKARLALHNAGHAASGNR